MLLKRLVEKNYHRRTSNKTLDYDSDSYKGTKEQAGEDLSKMKHRG